MNRSESKFGVLPEGASADDFVGMLEEFGEIGYWHVDIETERVFWSSQVCLIHGVEPDQNHLAVGEAIRWYHEDDRAAVTEAVQSAKEAGVPFHFVHRIRRKSGEIRWVESRGSVRRDDDGIARAIFGTCRDVTEQREADEFSTRVRSSIEKLDGALVIFDSDDRLFLCNEKYRNLYPKSAPIIDVGVRFEDMIKFGIDQGEYLDAIGNEEAFLAERMRKHLNPTGPIEQRLGGGRWVRVSESITDDGSRVGFRIDVTEMKAMQQELATKAREALAAGQIKDRFLANMSHELRTPLNAVIGFAQLIQMMKGQSGITDQVAGYAGDIESSGAHLLAILEDMFRLAQMEAAADRVTVKFESVDVGRLLDDVRSLTGALAREHGQKVVVDDLSAQSWQINADTSKMQKVLVNLVSNAIKFSPSGSEIRVFAELGADGRLLIKVIDHGPGIAEENRDKIFEKFERLDACSDAIGGVGLGLSIARDLVSMMHGELGVDSCEGEGSTFWLAFDLCGGTDMANAG